MLLSSAFRPLRWTVRWFQANLGNRNTSPCSRIIQRRRFWPVLEVLEDRTVPSGGYAFTTIDDPNGVNGSFADGINARGQIVGGYTTVTAHGFLLSDGQYTTLDDPNGVNSTVASGINASGSIVGFYIDANFQGHGFLLRHGEYTTIDDPNASFLSEAKGINARGQIVGAYIDSNDAIHGFLLSHCQYTTLDDPNAGTGFLQGTYANGINASGQIVGLYIDANNAFHGYLLSDGQYTTIDDPNAVPGFFLGSAASGINDHGQIVGGYSDVNTVSHGYLLSDGQYTTLDDPNAGTGFFPQGTGAGGINNSGKIVGSYVDDNFAGHAFLATPTHGDDAPFDAAKTQGLGVGPAGSGAANSLLLTATAIGKAIRSTNPIVVAASASGPARGEPGVLAPGDLAAISGPQFTAVTTAPIPLTGGEGVYIASGTTSMQNLKLDANVAADSSAGSRSGAGQGSGIHVHPVAIAGGESTTVSGTLVSTGDDDIFGVFK